MNKNYLKLVAASLLVGLTAACTSITPNYSSTGLYDAASLSENCDVAVFTSVPPVKYVELGVIELDVIFGFTKPDYLTNAGKFRDQFRVDVCRAGGNGLLLWEAYGSAYLKATVVKFDKPS